MDDLDLMARPAPTASRPLLGMTLLVVEDSRFASEAVRLLALRSGARLRRADTLAAARRHLSTYRPDVVIVDLGLPDGSGLDLIAELDAAQARPRVILATSGRPEAAVRDAVGMSGADAFLPKPIESLAAFQHIVLTHLPGDHRPPGLRVVTAEEIAPDRLALTEDLAYADRALTDGWPSVYVAGFLEGLARTGHDDVLLAQARALAARRTEDVRPMLRALISERLGEARRVV